MHRSPTAPACLLLALLALFAGTAHATTIYRCTDAKGSVTMQNDTPCPAGSKQEVRQIGELPTAPAPVGKPAAAPVAKVPPPGSSFELVRGPVTEQLPDTKVAAADRKP